MHILCNWSTIIDFFNNAVSTQDQDVQLQVNALEKAGCSKGMIFIDKISGTKSERPGLEKCLAALSNGDTLLVWRLDRLGRSMPHLVQLVEDLGNQGIGFRSLCDGAIDTTTASGELIFNIFSSLAQFERNRSGNYTLIHNLQICGINLM